MKIVQNHLNIVQKLTVFLDTFKKIVNKVLKLVNRGHYLSLDFVLLYGHAKQAQGGIRHESRSEA